MADPARAVMLKTTFELTAPAGTVTVTPASGIVSVPPPEPMVLVTVIGDASGVVRWTLPTRLRFSRSPIRPGWGACGTAAVASGVWGATGAVVGSPEQAAI